MRCSIPLSQILKVSVRDAADVRAYAPPPSVPTANLLYGEIAYVTDKARVGWERARGGQAAKGADDAQAKRRVGRQAAVWGAG
jgi:hypothetical protein